MLFRTTDAAAAATTTTAAFLLNVIKSRVDVWATLPARWRIRLNDMRESTAINM